MQEQIYNLLQAQAAVPVTFVDQDGSFRTEPVGVSSLPLLVVLRRTWLIYLVVVVCLSSAVSVFRRHHSPQGAVLAFFLLASALYFTSSAPLVARSITLTPFAFKLFTVTLHTAAGGLSTLAHFALLFPGPKRILKNYPWMLYLPYASFLLATTLYLSGMTAFGTTFPLLFAWVMVTAGAFLHSLMKAGDPFLRKQIRLSLMAPVLVSLFFICLYLLPGVLRLPPVDFRYFALFFLLLPFALPLAMDNLALYHERLAVEQASQQEKEHIRADLHDLILNNLAVISRTSEVAQTQLGGGNVSVSKRLETIQDLTAKTSRRLREFLWVLDDRHSSWDAVSSHLRSWGHEITEDTGCEFELEVAQEVSSLSPPDLRLRITLDRIYKEAILNAVTHARAGQIKASLFCHGATVICAVQDNGIGFVLDTALDGHYGIRNMQRRAEELGGTVTITSQCGQGTSVKIELPLQ